MINTSMVVVLCNKAKTSGGLTKKHLRRTGQTGYRRVDMTLNDLCEGETRAKSSVELSDSFHLYKMTLQI